MKRFGVKGRDVGYVTCADGKWPISNAQRIREMNDEELADYSMECVSRFSACDRDEVLGWLESLHNPQQLDEADRELLETMGKSNVSDVYMICEKCGESVPFHPERGLCLSYSVEWMDEVGVMLIWDEFDSKVTGTELPEEGDIDEMTKPEDLSCYQCPDRERCEFAGDPYNTDGDCLALK